MPPRPILGSGGSLNKAARAATLRNRALDRAAENQMDPALLNPVGSTPGKDDFAIDVHDVPAAGPYDDAILR